MPRLDVSNSVVRVKGMGPKWESRGTGFIIHRDTDRGTYILTCRHVVIGDQGDRKLFSALIDGKYPADIAWASEKKPGEERIDLAVVTSKAPELEDRPTLPIGTQLTPEGYGIISYHQPLFRDFAEAERLQRSYHELKDQTTRWLELKNSEDRDKALSPGDSGSPVMDETTDYVVGVVVRVGGEVGSEVPNGLIVATTVHELKNWPEKPSDLIIHQPKLPANALWRDLGLRLGTTVDVLAGASSGLDNELAIVREVKEKVREAPVTRKFPLNLADWVTVGTRRPLEPDWEKTIEGFNGLILIVGSSLIASESCYGLDVLERATRESRRRSEHRRALIYHVTPPQQAHAPEVDEFFAELNREGVPYVTCVPADFPDRFWADFQVAFQHLVEAAIHPQDRDPKLVVTAAPKAKDNPYLGLSSYRREDGWRFHGRANEVTELRDRLAMRPHGFLAVAGSSGCGKSSLVCAGLLPRLKMGALPSSVNWQSVVFKISQIDELTGRVARLHPPLATMALAMIKETPQAFQPKSAGPLLEKLGNPATRKDAVDLVLKGSAEGARLVIVVDQFEEVFTIVTDYHERTEFLSALRGLAGDPRVDVIITIRDDFYARLMATGLGELAEIRNPYWVKPPSVQSLFSAIFFPAVSSGFSFEDESLPIEILQDAGAGPGALPLLSYALQRLVSFAINPEPGANSQPQGHAEPKREPTWELTRYAYEKIGKVQGAIQATADEAVASLTLGPKTMGQLFRRVVSVDEHGTATKKPAIFDPGDRDWTKEEKDLKDALVNARLLVSRVKERPVVEGFSSRTVIEIAHEALLKSWDALKDWIKKSQGDLLLIQDIEREADSWAKEKSKAAELGGEMRIRKELEIDHLRLKPQELLDQFYTAVESVLGLWRESLLAPSTRHPKAVSAAASGRSGAVTVNSEDVSPADSSPASNGTPFSAGVLAFIRREPERLIAEISISLLDHKRRADIGERLAQLDDRRPGVGLDEKGLPNIEWLLVPEGKVTLVDKEGGSIGTFDVKPVYIARYPVTICQFDVFSKPTVYYDTRWWKGLEIDPERHGPELQKPGTANHPAQFVSWFQGVAFCRWLSHELGYTVRLPTEWEWQMAAIGGRQDYEYPWGKWDATRANFRQGVYKLMSVGMYPDGRSPIGAYDMSGNMYEWCANEFDKPAETGTSGTNPRTTRGGAFFSDEADLRVTHRLRDNANGVNELGKRIAVCIRLAADAPTKGIATD